MPAKKPLPNDWLSPYVANQLNRVRETTRSFTGVTTDSDGEYTIIRIPFTGGDVCIAVWGEPKPGQRGVE